MFKVSPVPGVLSITIKNILTSETNCRRPVIANFLPKRGRGALKRGRGAAGARMRSAKVRTRSRPCRPGRACSQVNRTWGVLRSGWRGKNRRGPGECGPSAANWYGGGWRPLRRRRRALQPPWPFMVAEDYNPHNMFFLKWVFVFVLTCQRLGPAPLAGQFFLFHTDFFHLGCSTLVFFSEIIYPEYPGQLNF